MSDRRQVLDLPTGVEDKGVEMFVDGESGTWRLFLRPGHSCVDFSLAGLRAFHEALGEVVRDIEADPEGCNAEVRRAWEQSD